MPHIRVISAGGSEQRRLVESTLAALKKQGYSDVRHQDCGDWGELLTENVGGGLFDERSVIVVEGAEKMEMMPERFEPMLEPPGSFCVILLVHSTKQEADEDEAQSSRRPIPIPKALLAKCVVEKGEKAPAPWAKERDDAVIASVRSNGADIDRDAVVMLKELCSDMAELRSEASLLALRCVLAGRNKVTAADVAEFCMSDGERDLLAFLDGLCERDVKRVRSAFAGLERKGDLIPLLAALHNRMRIAYYQASYGDAAHGFVKAIGASPYASKSAERAVREYGKSGVLRCVMEVIRISVNERSGAGAGWKDLEMLVLGMLASKRRA